MVLEVTFVVNKLTLPPIYHNNRTTTLVRESTIGSGFNFPLLNTPLTNSLRVFSHGILKELTNDFTLSTNIVSFVEPRPPDSNLNFFYMINGSQSPLHYFQVEQKAFAGSTEIELGYPPYSNLEEVYKVGELLHPVIDYNVVGNVIELVTPTVDDTWILVNYWSDWS